MVKHESIDLSKVFHRQKSKPKGKENNLLSIYVLFILKYFNQ